MFFEPADGDFFMRAVWYLEISSPEITGRLTSLRGREP